MTITYLLELTPRRQRATANAAAQARVARRLARARARGGAVGRAAVGRGVNPRARAGAFESCGMGYGSSAQSSSASRHPKTQRAPPPPPAATPQRRNAAGQLLARVDGTRRARLRNARSTVARARAARGGRSVGRSVGWSVGRLDSRSVGRLVGWSIGRSVGRLIDWSDDRSVGRSVGRPVGRWMLCGVRATRAEWTARPSEAMVQHPPSSRLPRVLALSLRSAAAAAAAPRGEVLPALFAAVAVHYLPDTPPSLAARGRRAEALEVCSRGARALCSVERFASWSRRPTP